MKQLSLYLISFFFGLSLHAQSFQGKLIDENDIPIDFATIQIKNKENHTHSNEQGYFNLKGVTIGDTIIISHFLFETKHVYVKTEFLEEFQKIEMIQKQLLLDNVNIVTHRPIFKTLANIDLKNNPVSNSQELLRMVPGLIIGQHAGGGKAEQMFLRGFDIDHGTDINITVDNIPVNMVSHAHGQGYADLHFLIPETVDNIEYGKGPYYIEKGNFTTAGFVEFKTKNDLKGSLFKTEVGQFNTLRSVALMDLTAGSDSKGNGYLAGEYFLSDGPFDAPQAFNRYNLFGKYNYQLSENQNIKVSLSTFNSKWDASGQIPQRAIDAGIIGRFGAIDKNEGGKTSRQNVNLTYEKLLSNESAIHAQAYYTHYNFNLFSNFTFFLNHPLDGDQINQSEHRNIYGLNLDYTNNTNLSGLNFSKKIYFGTRNDDVNDVQLSNTKNRAILLEQKSLGDVSENNLYTGVSLGISNEKFLLNMGVRADHIKFNYQNRLDQNYALLSSQNTLLQPKINFQYNLSRNIQVYVKGGKGFHSNDTRVAISGTAQNSMPAAYGADLGLWIKPIKNILINAAVWTLNLDQEFVYVGDEGIVENAGKTKRQGLDFSLRYNPNNWLFIYNNICLAKPRLVGEESGNDFIPLAPTFTNTGGINFDFKKWNAGFRYRHITDRPANEDNSIVALGYNVIDANISYELHKIVFGIEVLNVLNTAWNETQFATESRLQNEAEPVEEIHFTPGVPFMLKGKFEYRF